MTSKWNTLEKCIRMQLLKSLILQIVFKNAAMIFLKAVHSDIPIPLPPPTPCTVLILESIGFPRFLLSRAVRSTPLFVFRWFEWPLGLTYNINYLGCQPSPALPLITNT